MNTNMAVRVSGPFFTLGAGPIRESLHDAVNELVARGEEIAKEKAIDVVYSKGGAHPERYRPTGHWLRSIHGEMVGPFEGRLDDSRLIYGAWLEGTGSRNQTTRFKGYRTFRHTYTVLEREKGGIVVKHVRKAVKKLQ